MALSCNLFVFHDSAGVNLLAAQFELRLDKDEKAGAGLCHGYCGRDYLPDRDERNINHHDVDAFGRSSNPQFARIPLDWNNARILAQLPVELFDVYVEGVDTFGALLEQAISEAAFDEPISRQTRPAGSIAKSSSAPSSLFHRG